MRVILISALVLLTLIGNVRAEDPAFAKIIQSGSTNSRGYVVSIQDDGGATVILSGPALGRFSSPTPAQPQNFPAGTIDSRMLQQLLAAVGDVSQIPIGGCAKSASFGTRTQIEYNGQTSGDLQCIRQAPPGDQQATVLQNAQALEKFIQSVQQKLQINIRPVRSLARPLN